MTEQYPSREKREMSMQIKEVAPGDLIVAANVRRDVALSKECVASVKQHGVKVPVLVQEGATGLEVLDGQRRTLAAVEAGLKLVPVVVQESVADDGARIVEQLVVNGHRSSLSTADEVEAVRDLALFGLSASQIARKTGSKRAVVDVCSVPRPSQSRSLRRLASRWSSTSDTTLMTRATSFTCSSTRI